MQSLQQKVVDRTVHLYKDKLPARIRDGKTLVLAALAPQEEHVKSVQFLENFELSPTETAVAGAARYTGVVVSLTPDYRLSDADAVWFNGPYSETLSMYPMAEGKFKQLNAELMHPDDSHAVSGIYEKNEQDAFTGAQTTRRFCLVNASAGDLSRRLMQQWTADRCTVRDAYEKAATEDLISNTTGFQYDNMRHYIEHVAQQMSAEMGACGDACHAQITNTFVRAAHSVVHFLNGAAVPVSDEGVLCHVSPLHGFVRLPRVRDRTFYPASLMSASNYVDVAALEPSQRESIFRRALWPGCSETTVNPYALRRPIEGWQQSALPQPTEVFRMHKANFSLDPRSCAALTPAAVLSMTPAKEHAVEGLTMPKHVQQNRVQLSPHDGLIAQLVSMRESFPILNPSYFSQHEQTGEWQLTLPRDVVAQLH
jgi:hypothetical protein